MNDEKIKETFERIKKEKMELNHPESLLAELSYLEYNSKKKKWRMEFGFTFGRYADFTDEEITEKDMEDLYERTLRKITSFLLAKLTSTYAKGTPDELLIIAESNLPSNVVLAKPSIVFGYPEEFGDIKKKADKEFTFVVKNIKKKYAHCIRCGFEGCITPALENHANPYKGLCVECNNKKRLESKYKVCSKCGEKIKLFGGN